MKRTTAAFFHFLMIGVLGAQSCDEETARDSVARLSPISPFPALVTAARANNIPLEQVDPPASTEIIDPGDSFTALVTLCRKGSPPAQWLLYLQAEADDPKEQVMNSPATMVIYNTLGNKLEFVSSPTLVTLRTFGPFAESQGKVRPPKAPEKNARFAVDKGWLGLGLDQAAAVFLRLKKSKIKAMVLRLNHHPALNLTLVVTPPHPPLLTCAGIVGVLAEKPDDKDTYLTLRIVSARRRGVEPPNVEKSQP